MASSAKVKPEIQRRFLDLDDNLAVKDDVYTLSVSSEYPVTREYGDEILLHTKQSINLERFTGGKAPVLWNHNPDEMIGTVVRSYLDGKKLKADIKFGSSEKAEQIRKDVEAGIVKNASIGYVIEDMEQDEKGRMVVTRFSPMELSLVAIPADPSVGFRSYQTPKGEKMSEQPSIVPESQPIQALSNNWEERQYGEYQREAGNFSIVKAMQASVSGNWNKAGREREIQQELSHRNGRTSQGIFVPHENWKTRDYTVGSATGGGNLVGTQHLPENFVDVLRAKSVVSELGATILPGLVGDVSIPTRTAGATAYFVAESGSITESTGTFGTISMSPKVMGAYSQFSHLMKLQATPEIEGLIRDDFISTLASKLDTVALNGGGSNEPSGIIQTSGIGSVAIGTNGGAITLDKVLDLKQTVAVDNADVANCAFVTNTVVENALSKLKDGNSAYHLNPYAGSIGQQQLANRSFMVTNNVPSNLTKGSSSGVCSAMIYGNFSDLLIGTFGTTEILVDPYSAMQTGVTAVRILQAVDIKVRHAESFGAILDITT